MWVRGLKLAYQKVYNDFYRSHPVWVRGLKPVSAPAASVAAGSHPVWVRGLKQAKMYVITTRLVVAPRVGAWIETGAFE